MARPRLYRFALGGGGGGDGAVGVGTFECSLRHPSPRAATICGTRGVIVVEYPFWCPTAFTVQQMDGEGSQRFGAPTRHAFDLPPIAPRADAPFHFVNSQGFAYEARSSDDVCRVRSASPHSEKLPLFLSLSLSLSIPLSLCLSVSLPLSLSPSPSP